MRYVDPSRRVKGLRGISTGNSTAYYGFANTAISKVPWLYLGHEIDIAQSILTTKELWMEHLTDVVDGEGKAREISSMGWSAQNRIMMICCLISGAPSSLGNNTDLPDRLVADNMT